MLITSRFVVLNLPKTGSSFVRTVIKKIYRHRRWKWGADRFLRELLLPPVQGPGPKGQHGSWIQVPARWRHLPAVAVVRSPYQRLLSIYEYRWWVKHPFLPPAEQIELFPHFPDLSLDDFVEVIDRAAARAMGGANPRALGRQTIQFVRFFFTDPDAALARLSDDYVASGDFRADMAPVTFLKQERLNDELADFLSHHAFSADEVALCRGHERVNPTVGGTRDRASLWTPRALDYVEHNERYLLAMLAQCGIRYEIPPAAAGLRTAQAPAALAG